MPTAGSPGEALMPYRPMTEEQVRDFLTASPPRTGKLATVRADGRPHVAPVWYDLDPDGTVVFNTGAQTVKGRNLARDPRASLCVDDDRPPFSFVTVEGLVELSDDLEVVRGLATRLGLVTWAPIRLRRTVRATGCRASSRYVWSRRTWSRPPTWPTESCVSRRVEEADQAAAPVPVSRRGAGRTAWSRVRVPA